MKSVFSLFRCQITFLANTFLFCFLSLKNNNVHVAYNNRTDFSIQSKNMLRTSAFDTKGGDLQEKLVTGLQLLVTQK